MNSDDFIGSKIKQFRIRSKKSQLELEYEADISSGSLSRIESGKINPDKETLFRIVSVLKLTSKESASLFNIDISYDIARVVNLSKVISEDLDLDKIVQNAVNEIAVELDITVVVLFIIKEDSLFAKTFTNGWFYNKVNEVLPVAVDKLNISLSEHKDNLAIKSINEQRIIYTEDLYQVSKYFIPKTVSDFIVNLANLKVGILIPLVDSNNISIGTLFFTKDRLVNFDSELPILKALSEYLTVSIINASKYRELYNKLKIENN